MKFNLKQRCRTYSFWLSIFSAIFLIIQAIGEPLGFKISEESYMSAINGVLAIFVFFGIISDPSQKTSTSQENLEETNSTLDEDLSQGKTSKTDIKNDENEQP